MLTTKKFEAVKKFLEENEFETLMDQIEALCLSKSDFNLTWEDVAEVSSRVLGTTYKEGYFRKNFGDALKVKTAIPEDLPEEEVQDEFENRLLTLKKEKVKLSDERTQNNAYIRRLAREDTIKEIALDFAEKMSAKKLLNIPTPVDEVEGAREAILALSDWHLGIEVDNALNQYNPDICKDRVARLTQKTLQHCRAYKIKTLNVLNLGDLIAGRIHLTLRLESRYDVITQIMEVSEILAEQLTELSTDMHVNYYSCVDNHSRLEPKKTDSLELETLSRITDWYLRERLKDNPNVVFHRNVYGPDIITFTCKGHNIAAAHGDLDSPTAAATSIARLTRGTYDMVVLAHRHHFAADELNQTVVIQNGSLMGVDSYSFKLRLSADPSQNLIIVSEDNVTESIHRIILK